MIVKGLCCEYVGFVHCRVNTPRKQGGLGSMKIPLLADKTLEISKAYGVLKEDEGISFRWAISVRFFYYMFEFLSTASCFKGKLLPWLYLSNQVG